MKQVLFPIRWLILLLLGLQMSCLQAEIPPPTRLNKRFVIAAHEWPPFASRETRYLGVLPRLISEIMARQGVTVEYRFMPWHEALDGVVSEEFDGALIWMMEDLKQEAFIISEPILEYRSALYYRNNLPKPRNADDLLGFRIGLNPYYVYDVASYQLMKSRSMIPVKGATDRDHFNNLLKGEIDFYLSPLLTSAPLLRHNYPLEQQQQLAYSTDIFTFPPSCLLVNRRREGSADFITKFNDGLKRAENDGTLDRYLDDLRFDKY